MKIKLNYTKGLEVRFISHLDLIRLFERAIRRANLPIAYSLGFNPRMKIKYGQALKVGQSSENEELEMLFENTVAPEEIVEKLNRVMPNGIKILTAQVI